MARKTKETNMLEKDIDEKTLEHKDIKQTENAETSADFVDAQNEKTQKENEEIKASWQNLTMLAFILASSIVLCAILYFGLLK